MFIIIPSIGWMAGAVGFIWSRKYLRYGIPAAALVGMGGMYAIVKNMEANAGPYGLRYNDIVITHPETLETVSVTDTELVDFAVGAGKDKETVRQMVRRYKNGHDYATGWDLLEALKNI